MTIGVSGIDIQALWFTLKRKREDFISKQRRVIEGSKKYLPVEIPWAGILMF